MRKTVEAEFAEAKESISWANEAIAEFDTAARNFFQPDAAVRITEINPDTGEKVLKVRLVKPLPRAFRRKATEALTALRHSFDQATFAARNLTSRRSTKSVYYPWSQGPTDLVRLLKERGIDQRLWDIFASHEPYARADGHAGGDDTIRALASIANKKHTVGLTVAGMSTGWAGGEIRANFVHTMSVSSGRWDPVNNEIELVRWIGDLDVCNGQTVYFQIFLKDARLPDGTVAKSALEAFSAKANAVVESLEARCLELLV